MTPLQEQAIADVRKILSEHFDSWLVSYKLTNENLKSKINHDWHGDITDVVGLADITHSRLLEITSLKGRSDE